MTTTEESKEEGLQEQAAKNPGEESMDSETKDTASPEEPEAAEQVDTAEAQEDVVDDTAKEASEKEQGAENDESAADNGDASGASGATNVNNTADGETTLKSDNQEPTSSSADEEKDGDDTNDNDKKRSASELIPSKPKKARTGYMIFQDTLREKGLSVDPGESWLKVVGQQWAAISPEEKEAYREVAAKEREQVAALIEERNKAIKEAGLDPKHFDDDKDAKDGSKDASGLVFPVARIRRIAKLDPEVKNLSKEAIHLVVKAAELFTAQLGQETTGVARIQNRRTLLPQDVAHVCRHVSSFHFLKDDIQDLVAQKVRQREESNAENGGGGGAAGKTVSKKDAQREAAAAGSKPLTAYFGAANASN